MLKLPKLSKLHKKPTVSVCTVTFNRRPFLPYLIKCMLHQTYPHEKIEWIIIDDGTDPIEDLLSLIPKERKVIYIGPQQIQQNKKLTLGQKRNLSHQYASGDVLLYMDDDDYYPPERISHAIEMLQMWPKAWIAASSEMHIYFRHINQLVQFGPYEPKGPFGCSNHGTAATFAFRKELLEHTQYDETSSLAEEKSFLKEYKIPMIQLETRKTILVFSHNQNSFDKKMLLEDINRNPFVKTSSYKIDDFIKEPELKQFYMHDIDTKCKDYTQGELTHKPDIIKQIKEITLKREKIIGEMQKKTQKELEFQTEMSNISQLILNNKSKQEFEQKIEYLQKKIIEFGYTNIKSKNEKESMDEYMSYLNNTLKTLIQNKIIEKKKQNTIQI